MHIIRLLLVVMMLSIITDVHAARMSDYADNTTPNADVYFIGVDPNDMSQTVRGSNYRYSLASILGNGLLDATFKSLTVSGAGDSWLELENNTSFTDSLTGKYGIRFYNGVLQQILNGTATNIGSASIQELASDPAYTDLDTGEMAVSTASGDLFIKTATGLYTIAGTYTVDPTTPTLVSLTIPAAGTTAEAVFSEAMTIGAGGAGGWTLNDPTVAMTRTGGAGTVEDPVIFSLARTVLSTATENPYASYTQPTNGFESADDGVDLASIQSASVTNGSTQTNNPYTVLFSDDFNRADNASVQSGSSWTSEADTAGIASILNNAYSIANNGTATARVSKTLSSNNSDYKISYNFKMADVLGVDNSGSARTVLILTLQSSAGAYLTVGIGCNTSGDPYRFIVTRTNDAGSASTTYTNFTFTADQYITLTVISDIGSAATTDGICNIIANSTTLLDLTGVADETRPIVSEVRLGISTSNTLWNQANTFTYDNFVMEYK